MTVGANWGSRIGVEIIVGAHAGAGALTTYAMAASDKGWCARFRALSTKDIKSVLLSWNAVTTPGTVELRIETIDATTGKPTGTLYDANASLAGIVPAAGLQTYTFATLPTAGLTVGTEYAIVLITTGAGTTQTLDSHIGGAIISRYPIMVQQSSSASSRSTFADTGFGAVPVISLILEDDSIDGYGMYPYHALTTNAIYGSGVLAGLKIIIPVSLSIAGVYADSPIKVGTPAGDLRCRVFSGSNVVSGTTVTLDKDSIGNFSGRRTWFLFGSPVTLSAGTYRIMFDSAGSANSSNCYNMRSVKFMNAAYPSAYILSTSADDGANWTDSTTDVLPAGFILDDFVSASGGISKARLLNTGF